MAKEATFPDPVTDKYQAVAQDLIAEQKAALNAAQIIGNFRAALNTLSR